MDFPGHFEQIFQQLNYQRVHGQLCDCVIVVGSRHFKAHRSVLAACSTHFRALFTVAEGDASMNMIQLDSEVVTAEAFAALVDMMYTSTLMLGESNVMDILLAASHLHLNNVVKACKHYLTTRTLPMSPSSDRPAHHHPQQEQQRHRQQQQVADLAVNPSLAANANLAANAATSKLQRSFLLQQLGLSLVSSALGGMEEDGVGNVVGREVVEQRASFPIRRFHKRKPSMALGLSEERPRQRQRPSAPNLGLLGEGGVNAERGEGVLLSPDSHKMGDESKLDAITGLVGVSQDDPQMPSQSDSGHCEGEDLGRMQGGVSKEEDMEDQDQQDSMAGVKIKSGTEEEEAEEQKVVVKREPLSSPEPTDEISASTTSRSHGNHIFQGQAAGIAINENGRGMITENVIKENQWGGVDIRRGGDPILRNNYICYGYSDGVVVGERGRGLIEGNHVYCNKGCGVWVMSSSLPQLLGNYITHNCMYGLAVFCRKDPENIDAREGNWPGQEGLGGDGGGGERRGVEGEGREGQENLNEEGELFAWESDLDSEDERHSARRSISVALVESNCMNYNGAVGLYVKSSEPLNVFANLVNSNRGTGIAVLQSSQLTRLVTNCILDNGRGGVTVEKDCRVELRGNGIYQNSGHGVSFSGTGQIVENDVVGNRGYGIQVSGSADIKVLRNRVQPAQGCGIAVLGPVKGVVHDNLLFQGHPGNKRTLLHTDPGNESCVLRNNSVLRHNNSCTSAPPWILENPPPRPLASSPSGLSSSQYPSRLGISMTTRISATVESGCHSGSMFCSIL